MKNLYCFVFFLFINQVLFSQKQNLNLVIFINDELVEDVYDLNINIDDTEKFPAKYIIGELDISPQLRNEITKQPATIKFSFKSLKKEKIASVYDSYTISLSSDYLKRKFVVIRIYNKDDKNYRKKLKKKKIGYDYNIYSDGVYMINI